MGIGASVLLIAIGAILTFALNVQIGFLDLDIVGWILMVAGVVGLIFTTLIWGPRNRRSVTRDTVDPVDTTTTTTTPTTSTYRRRQVEEHTDV